MGKTVAETRREIDALRSEIEVILEELARWRRNALNVRRQVATHPRRVALVAGALGLALGGLALLIVRSVQARRRRARRMAAWLPERVRAIRAGESRGPAIAARPGAGLLHRTVWAGVSAALVALGGLLGRRAGDALWRRVAGEQTPAQVDR